MADTAELWQRFLSTRGSQEPDEEARTKLIEANKGLVEQVLRSFKRVRQCDRDDLRGAGYVGLIQAVDTWNPERMEWERFAKLKIQDSCVDHIRACSWRPKSIHRQAEKLDAAEDALCQELGRQPTPAELGERLGLAEEETLALLSEVRGTDGCLVSLDWRSESECPWSEVVADDNAEDPARVALTAERRTALRHILARLTEREQQVIRWRYFEHRPQVWIAGQLGVHELRVSQILATACDRARALSEQRVLELT